MDTTSECAQILWKQSNVFWTDGCHIRTCIMRALHFDWPIRVRVQTFCDKVTLRIRIIFILSKRLDEWVAQLSLGSISTALLWHKDEFQTIWKLFSGSWDQPLCIAYLMVHVLCCWLSVKSPTLAEIYWQVNTVVKTSQLTVFDYWTINVHTGAFLTGF